MNYKRQGGQAVQSGQPARVKDGRFVLKATPKEGSLDAHYYVPKLWDSLRKAP